MPVTVKAKTIDDNQADDPAETFTRFIHRPRWFVLSQTDGADYTPVQMPTWSEPRALEQLAISRRPRLHPALARERPADS